LGEVSGDVFDTFDGRVPANAGAIPRFAEALGAAIGGQRNTASGPSRWPRAQGRRICELEPEGGPTYKGTGR
jgi:hypothetical protein